MITFDICVFNPCEVAALLHHGMQFKINISADRKLTINQLSEVCV